MYQGHCKGKAQGIDSVRKEHLSAASSVISPVLAHLFTWMLRLGHIPPEVKTGEIFTLHKGGKKRKDNLTYYRAITLSSAILKHYEMVLLDKCQDDRQAFDHMWHAGLFYQLIELNVHRTTLLHW